MLFMTRSAKNVTTTQELSEAMNIMNSYINSPLCKLVFSQQQSTVSLLGYLSTQSASNRSPTTQIELDSPVGTSSLPFFKQNTNVPYTGTDWTTTSVNISVAAGGILSTYADTGTSKTYTSMLATVTLLVNNNTVNPPSGYTKTSIGSPIAKRNIPVVLTVSRPTTWPIVPPYGNWILESCVASTGASIAGWTSLSDTNTCYTTITPQTIGSTQSCVAGYYLVGFTVTPASTGYYTLNCCKVNP